ncbi:hypothetical protein ACHAWU_009031 [Discostella pseudostelligera]|uniref:SWI5-dependent HO expression protein 3 n=1 Tax=Discostella pseudostelligera TaxID=259834 RepID=A0ABD3MCS2_9STRA
MDSVGIGITSTPTPTAGAASRPAGAMSLLDKYASINASIEDARRRVTDVRSTLEACNLKIASFVEERNGMQAETEQANNDKVRLLAQLKQVEKLHATKLMEKERVQNDQRLAQSEYDKMRRFIEDERMDFLERGREFRSECKRLRVASSILVLECGGAGGCLSDNDMTDEADLWRRLQQQDFSGASNNDTNDVELELAERNDKESREELAEIEAALNTERIKYDDAINRSNARNQRLTQQRAQLQRHRKEVEDLEREIQSTKNSIVEENQLAHTFEKECARRKQIGGFNINASNNPTISNQHTPPTIPSFGNNQNARGGVVTNPYSKQAIRDPSSNAPRNAQSNNSGNDIPSGKEGNNVLPYASNMMTHGITPEFHQGQQRNREINTQHHHHHHPHRHGGYVRNQRQFGTSVGVSIDSGVMDAPRTTSLSSTTPLSYPPSSTKYMANTTEDSLSDASSASSDEDILSFNIFGKK